MWGLADLAALEIAALRPNCAPDAMIKSWWFDAGREHLFKQRWAADAQAAG